MSVTTTAHPSLPTATQLLTVVPRLLSMHLAHRESRALVRLARRLGYGEAAVLGIRSQPRVGGVELQAASRTLSSRLELEVLGSSEVAEWLAAIESPVVVEPADQATTPGLRMLLRLGLDSCTLIPLCRHGRLMVLADGPAATDETLQALTALATTILDTGLSQRRAHEFRCEARTLRQQMVEATETTLNLQAETNRLRRLERLAERMEPVSAGVKELIRAAAESLGATLAAQVVLLLRPSRSELWVACSPDVEPARLDPLLRDALARVEQSSLERYHRHRVDANLGDLEVEETSGFLVEAGRTSLDGDRMAVISLKRSSLDQNERDFLETVGSRMMRALGEREMVGRILDHARFLERRLDQVVASYRIARTLAAPIADDEAAARILWDVRQSFHADAAVLLMEAPDDGRLIAVSAIEGGDRQERAFLSWAATQYRTRFDPELPSQLEVRRTHAIHTRLGSPRVEPLEHLDDAPQWWPSHVVAPFSMGQAPGLLCLGSRRPGEFGAEAETALRILAGDAAQTLGHLYGTAVRERRQLEQLVAHIPTAILLVGQNGELRLTNVATGRLLRLGERAPATMDELAATCGLDLGLLVEEVRSTSADVLGREVVWGESNPRYLRADASRVLDSTGRETGVLLALRDVTRMKRLELEQAEFVGTVSHELKTPLTSMKTALELILMGETGPVTEEQAHFLEMTKRNIDRLGRLIQQLLDVARQEAGRLKLDRQPTDLGALLVPALEAFQRTAIRDGRSLTWDLDDVEAFVDRDRFLEILENLVGNALKFTDPGGHIKVRLERGAPCPSPEVVALATHLGCPLSGVRLVVDDDGPGMEAETQELAFERFYQAGDPLADRPDGAGLGLAITRALVGAHDGLVDVESEPDRGTAIGVWVPGDAASGRVVASVTSLATELTRVQQRLLAGSLLTVPLAAEADLSPVREIISECGINTGRLCGGDGGVVFLVVLESEWGGALQRRLKAWATRQGGALGVAAFPHDGIDLGTLLALSLSRSGLHREALVPSVSNPAE